MDLVPLARVGFNIIIYNPSAQEEASATRVKQIYKNGCETYGTKELPVLECDSL